MRYGIMICGIISLLWMSSTAMADKAAMANNIASVSSSISDGAVFSTLSQNEDDKNKPTIYVADGDGAAVVVAKTTLITGREDAQFSVCESKSCKSEKIVFEKGKFTLHVGSKETIFQLGNITLNAREALLVAWKTEKGWTVAVEKFFTDGTATLKQKTKKQIGKNDSKKNEAKNKKKKNKHYDNEKPTIEPTKPKPNVVQVKLEVGGPVHIIKGKVVQSISLAAGAKMKKVVESLKDNTVTGSLLIPVDMESDKDIAAGKADQDRSFEEIEIEEIEVEAGCVEVCLD